VCPSEALFSFLYVSEVLEKIKGKKPPSFLEFYRKKNRCRTKCYLFPAVKEGNPKDTCIVLALLIFPYYLQQYCDSPTKPILIPTTIGKCTSDLVNTLLSSSG
jgi:hypothetical protein